MCSWQGQTWGCAYGGCTARPYLHTAAGIILVEDKGDEAASSEGPLMELLVAAVQHQRLHGQLQCLQGQG